MMFIVEQRTQESRAAEIHDGIPSKWEPWIEHEDRMHAEQDMRYAKLYRQDFDYRIVEGEPCGKACKAWSVAEAEG